MRATLAGPPVGQRPGPLACPLSGPLSGQLAQPSAAGGGDRYRDAAAAGRTGGSATPPSAVGGGRPQWSSDQLFGDRQEIEIVHGDSVYRLRVTSLGKLILTK